jgi:phosphatidylethanolamine-binding protein (PEBP) family uncharacterized protein
VHRYHFTVYALDCDHCDLEDDFTAVEALEVMEPHILAQARITGTYAIKPGVRV